MKNILITGGAGMIGSNLLKCLLRIGYNVKVVDNLYRGSLTNLEKAGLNLDCFLHYDLSRGYSDELKSFCSGIDVIYHLADIVAGIDFVFNNEYDIFTENIKINMTIAEIVNQNINVKLIYAGTACSFPESLQDKYNQDHPLMEKDLFPAKPESGYGWSKLIGQIQYSYLKKKHNSDIITLMFHNVYGLPADFSPERSQVIPSLIAKIHALSDGDKLVVWGSGEQSRAFVHVDDICDALVSTLSLEKCELNEIQIGPTSSSTINDVARLLIGISGKKLTIENDFSKPEGDKARFSDNLLAKQLLGWSPKVDLKDGLEKMYKYYNE